MGAISMAQEPSAEFPTTVIRPSRASRARRVPQFLNVVAKAVEVRGNARLHEPVTSSGHIDGSRGNEWSRTTFTVAQARTLESPSA